MDLEKSFWWTHVLLWGHWYPCFGLLVTSPLGFKAEWAALFALIRAIHDVCTLKFTFGATPANLLMTSMGAGHFPQMYISAEVGFRIRSGDLPHILTINFSKSLTFVMKFFMLCKHYLIVTDVMFTSHQSLKFLVSSNKAQDRKLQTFLRRGLKVYQSDSWYRLYLGTRWMM